MPNAPAPTRRTNEERSAATRHPAARCDDRVPRRAGLGAAPPPPRSRGGPVSRAARRCTTSRPRTTSCSPRSNTCSTRRNQEFREAFAALPADQRSPGVAMRLLRDACFVDTFDAWLELVVAARTDPALHARFVELESRFFETRSTTFRSMFPDARATRASRVSRCAWRSASSMAWRSTASRRIRELQRRRARRLQLPHRSVLSRPFRRSLMTSASRSTRSNAPSVHRLVHGSRSSRS